MSKRKRRTSGLPSQHTLWRSLWGSRIFRGAIFLSGFLLGGLALVYLILGHWESARIQDPLAADKGVAILKDHFPVAHYQGKGKQARFTFQKTRPASWVSIREIPKFVQAAFVVSEDGGFWKHDGIDPDEMKAALETNLKARRYVRGASTIPQQLVKNIFLTREKTLSRKIREVLLARELDEVLTKAKILEVYLNVIEFGENLYGIGPASRFYFQHSVSSLQPKEAAFLAMLLPNPQRNSQSFRNRKLSPFATRAVRRVLQRLWRAGYLNREGFQEELQRPLTFEHITTPPTTTDSEIGLDPDLDDEPDTDAEEEAGNAPQDHEDE